MTIQDRRRFIQTAAIGAAGAAAMINRTAVGQIPGERPRQAEAIRVVNPRNRVPVGLIIDDSTCLANLAYFGIPQFAQTFPEQYKQDWRSLPREIPDAFVRKFARWSQETGVKGKYSLVPYPACVGWLDRYLPGWTEKELKDSLDLVKTELSAHWDFHPEMVSHTRVIDIKTGRPFEDSSEYFMENWRWTDDKSVDELAAYIAYALNILKNAGVECEGMTTPGGFGSRVLPELAQATLQACREVYNAEIPHYFRHLFTDETSVAPRVEYAAGLESGSPECVVSIVGCTGDWFGGWDGLTPGSVDKLITEDLQSGRMVEVIERGEPAIMVCHWPGIYFNGEETGFSILKEAVNRLHQKYNDLIWMKNSEVARYWAARELTRVDALYGGAAFRAPFACPRFTVAVKNAPTRDPALETAGGAAPLTKVNNPLELDAGRWAESGEETLLCFDLPKGESKLLLYST